MTHYFHSPMLSIGKALSGNGHPCRKVIRLHWKPPKDIVKYDHDDLYFTFFSLFNAAKDRGKPSSPDVACRSPLEKNRDTLYVGRIEDERLLKKQNVIWLPAQMPEAKLIEGVPRVVKIASRGVIDSVTVRLPGGS